MYNDNWTELYHHGVKGQHWGERRWQNEDGSLTPAGYAHYGYKGKNIRISKGSKLYRRSLAPSMDIKRFNVRNMYVSPTKQDNETWKKFFKPVYGNSQFQINFKARKDLNVASQEDLAKATERGLHAYGKKIDRIYGSNKEVKKEVGETIKSLKSRASEETKRIQKSYYDRYKTKIEVNKDAVLGAMIISRMGNTSVLTNEITHQLVKQGKDAVMDIWGLDVAKSPVIIMNPGKNAKPTLGTLLFAGTGNTNIERYSWKENKATTKVRKNLKEI